MAGAELYNRYELLESVISRESEGGIDKDNKSESNNMDKGGEIWKVFGIREGI